MKIPLHKISSIIVLIFFILSNFLVPIAHAKNTETTKNKNNIILKEKYKGDKLEKIKKTLKQNDKYKILIKSDDDLEKVKSFFNNEDDKINIKEVGLNKYMIKIPTSSSFLSEQLKEIDNGVLINKIGEYEVVEPEIVESFDYLEGEELDNLWGNNLVGAHDFQEELSTKEKIKVGILDTGVDYNHIDLDDNFDSNLGYDFVNEDDDVMDDNGHGTQVTGIIGAEVNSEGIYGINSNADLVSLKVLDINGLGTSYDILEAIDYAKQNNIKILNMSFGGTGNPTTSTICEAITEAKNEGIFIITSAGNSGQELTNTIPAACSDSISVGSINQSSEISDFSNYGNLVDIYAPGENIYTTTINNNYTNQNGTSLSSAFISGLISKELAFDDSLSYDEILENLGNNYNLITNDNLYSEEEIEENTETSTGETSSGTTSTGTLELQQTDYSNYKYYSGTFLHNGILYGNSLYPNTIDFSQDDLTGIKIYTYQEYLQLNQTTEPTFSTLSIPTDGLVGSWDLDGNALDNSGNGNNGTPYNVSWVSSSGSNDVGSFNGTDSQIDITNFFLLNSFSIWLKSNFEITTSNTNGIASLGSDKYGIRLGVVTINAENEILTIVDGGNSDIFYWDSSDIYSISTEWHNIVIVWESGHSNYRLYYDGIDKGLANIYGNPGQISISRFGPYRTYQNFNGNIGLIKVYNDELSESEINQLYQEGQEKILGITVNNETQTNTITPSSDYVLSNTGATYDSTSSACYVNELNYYKLGSGDGSKQEKDSDNAGDPVVLSKGEFTYNNTLMSIPGERLGYSFDIAYRNQTYYNGPVGIKWDHNYNMFLQEEDNGNVVFYNGKLGVFRFIDNGTSFDYNQGLRANLVNTSGVYTIEFDNGDVYTFDTTSLKLTNQEDRYGNELSFAYSGGLVSTVTDTLGRDINYTYYEHNRLQEVTDFNGRKVEFSYYDGTTSSGSIYDLESIIINNGTGATKTISFEYDSDNNITKLIDSKGQTYVENTYDDDERVSTQVFGNGTISYSYTLDANDNITKNTVTDKLGNITEYNYDSSHNNTSTVYYSEDQTSSQTYTYEYDSLGFVTEETKPKGNGTKFTYDSRGNITERRIKTDMDASDSTDDLITTYTYNSFNQVLTQTNSNGVLETNTIDTNGNLTNKSISGLQTYTGATYNITSSYTYLTNGLLDTVNDGEGNLTDFNYGSGQVIEIVKGTGSLSQTGSFSYNDYGNIVSQTDGEGYTSNFELNDFNLVGTGTTSEGIITNYIYDENNNKIEEIRYLTGGLELHSYFYYDLLDNMTGSLIETSSGVTLLTSYTYDNNDNLIEKQVGDGAVYEYSYNAFGLLETETIILDETDSSKDIILNYTYDDNNNLISKTDALNNTTTYTYDLFDRLIKETNPEGVYTSFVYNKDGTISSKSTYDSSDTILSKTEYLYDGLGNIVKETSYTDAGNSTGAIIKSIIYDNNSKVIKQIDALGNETTNTYDILGRLDYSIDELGNEIDYEYDKRDLVTSKSIISNTGTGVITTTYTYDTDSRLLTETDNSNNTNTYEYNELNQIITKTDGENNTTDYLYDYIGNILSETKYLSGTTVTTSYTYDNRGNILSITDGEGNTTDYEYDGINRNTKVTYEDDSELVYIYDKNSNLISQTDPNGTITTNTYDSLNRLTGRSIQTGTGVIGITSESYTYDDLNRLISSSDNNNNNLGFNYDDLGRLTSETESGTTITYEYDNNNNLTKIIHPDSRETIYTYDELNRNTSITFSGETIATYSYTGILNDSISYGNGETITKTYDELLRLSSLNNGIKNYNYSYDDVGNITTDSYKNYSYDDIYRLTQVTDTSSGTILETFNYDNAGNRTNDLNNEYTTNELNQYLTLSGTTNTSFVYDNNGNIINNGEYNFEYDYKNRLVKVSDESGIISEFVYDTLGRRIEKQTEDETIKYVYSNKNVLEETKTKASGEYKKVYINGIGLDNLIAFKQQEPDLSYEEQYELDFCSIRVLPYETQFTKYSWSSIITRCNTLSLSGSTLLEKTYYFHKDHLGSVIGITNNNGEIISQYEYDVFGNVELVDGYDIGNTRLYTGREYDEEINLYYLRARYYDSEIGRFISRDPIGQVDDVNLYAYVGNNGVMFVDRMGLEKTLIIGFVGRTWNSYGEIDYNDYENHGIGQAFLGFEDDSNIETHLYYSSATKLGNEKWDAYNYILENVNNYENIIIVGNSLGADNAVELSNELGKKSITIDLLVTIDLQAYIDTTVIKNNTLNVNNYYQTHWNSIMNGDTLTLEEGNNITNLENIKANFYCDIYDCGENEDLLQETLYHTNIDDFLYRKIEDDIRYIIN